VVPHSKVLQLTGYAGSWAKSFEEIDILADALQKTIEMFA